ncbi:zinc finger protein 414 [Bombina bombina]|uniref:zinc finger protein 414 n=1 Tax=Bombina bombina TaxID=8345 RepID=UPI00235AF5C6|nr:zinc finger protein 414 [Bombina bombina]
MHQQDSQGASEKPTEDVPITAQPPRVVRKVSKREREKGSSRSLHPARRGHRCSSYGCSRTFLNKQDLITHVSVHYKPIQSMTEKQFLCSVTGCKEELSSMQDLMNHMKLHYKPNRYFKCENCMQHFRTHRSLFKHLHVCSDPNSRTLPLSGQSQTLSPDSKPAVSMEPVKRHTSVIKCVKKEAPFPNSTASMAPAAASTSSSLPQDIQSAMSSLVSQATNPFSLLDPALFMGRLAGQSPSSVAASFLPFLNPSAYSLSQASIPQRLVSNAVWKKNQGHSTNSRILWEHTRDSYNCMQCNFSTTSRDQMTKHIEEAHKNPPTNQLQAEMDYDFDLLPFHSKLSPEMEASLFPQT